MLCIHVTPTYVFSRAPCSISVDTRISCRESPEQVAGEALVEASDVV